MVTEMTRKVNWAPVFDLVTDTITWITIIVGFEALLWLPFLF